MDSGGVGALPTVGVRVDAELRGDVRFLAERGIGHSPIMRATGLPGSTNRVRANGTTRSSAP
jgi:hypothetical protein